MRASHTLLVSIALPLVMAGRADAGIVNVQSALATEAEEGLSGAIGGSADWRTGNTSLLILSLAPVTRFRSGDHLFVGMLRGEIGRSKGKRIISRTFEHARYRYQATDRVLAEVFAQHEFDEFRCLSIRGLVGAGPKVEIVNDKRLKLGVGVAYMLEYESIRETSKCDPDAGDTALEHRSSSYATGSFAVDDRLQLVQTVYAQPRLDDPSDIRLLNESQLVVKATKKVSLKTTFSLAYDTDPPGTVDNLDTTLKSSITLAF